ncbi:hypothetical protein JCM5353_000961 [Sporobolomyces roseus]
MSSTTPQSPVDFGECVVCGQVTTTRCSSCAGQGSDWMFFCSRDHHRLNQVVIDYPIDFFNNFEERTWEGLSTGHDWGSWRHPTQHRLLILASIYSQLCQDPSRKQELRPYFTHAHGALRKVLVDHDMTYTRCNRLCVQLGALFDNLSKIWKLRP